MHLSHVHIENFRGLPRLDLPLCPGLNVIIGENNVGKTAVVDAIRMALGPGSTGADRIWMDREDLTRTGPQTFGNPFRIDLTFSDLSTKEMGIFVEALDYNRDAPEKSEVSI